MWTHASPGRRNFGSWPDLIVLGLVLVFTLSAPAVAQDEEGAGEEQDAETKALDSTATQWSFQFAYQWMPSYHRDTIDSGEIRPAGIDNYFQVRIVAPLPLSKFTILPRLTLRHYENAERESGLGNTEIFGLIVPRSWDWGSGRVGIGPLVTLPGSKKVARDEWGYGFAAAAVNGSGQWFYGVLLTQSWRGVDPNALPPGASDTNPLGIAPFLNYRLGKGWYVGNGDMVAQWDWDSDKFYLPVAVRVGKVIVQPNNTWNLYAEYRTSVVYKDWPGSAVRDSYRINVPTPFRSDSEVVPAGPRVAAVLAGESWGQKTCRPTPSALPSAA